MKSTRLSKHKPTNLASEWFVGLTDEEKEDLRQYLKNSTRMFDLLKNMIQKRYDVASSVKDTDYDSASWAYKQAHRNGKLETLEDLYKLLP